MIKNLHFFSYEPFPFFLINNFPRHIIFNFCYTTFISFFNVTLKLYHHFISLWLLCKSPYDIFNYLFTWISLRIHRKSLSDLMRHSLAIMLKRIVNTFFIRFVFEELFKVLNRFILVIQMNCFFKIKEISLYLLLVWLVTSWTLVWFHTFSTHFCFITELITYILLVINRFLNFFFDQWWIIRNCAY